MKSFKLYLIVASAILLIYVVAQYNRPKDIDWSQTLSNTDKIPFGTFILYDRIGDIFPKAKIDLFKEPVYNVMNDHGIKHGTYIIICNSINLNEYDYTKLKRFIEAGNDVFISASYFGDEFKKELKIENRSEFSDTSTVGLKFTNSYLDSAKTYSVKKGMSDGYFKNLDTAKAIVLGKNDDEDINFVKYSIGKGNLYLNAVPLMFTNYSMLSSDGLQYATKALSYTKKDNYVMWDQYYTLGRDDDESSMRVFLRNPSLRWAFYIAFFSFVAFVIYEVKRRQRIIPVIEPLNNATLEFVNVVGQVYYEQRNNTNIAQKQATYFLEHVRTKYYLKTSILDDEFINALTHKSGVTFALIQLLITQIKSARQDAFFSDADLINLNKNIEQFYLKSRK